MDSKATVFEPVNLLAKTKKITSCTEQIICGKTKIAQINGSPFVPNKYSAIIRINVNPGGSRAISPKLNQPS